MTNRLAGILNTEIESRLNFHTDPILLSMGSTVDIDKEAEKVL